ncbi:TonB-dependent receptor domain-containing protein [Pedobacter lithocola]|uniref:TonB-dependent receptor domain-containing protein n=1 Tax=Pedobacter lithocola TaxID=1908239 RepID=A0ABV8PGB2_9SPHI
MKCTVTLLLCLFSLLCCAQNISKSKLDTLQNLKEVNVKSNFLQLIKEQPVNISIIDVKPFYNSNTTPIQLLKQSSGIKIKQDGGYGSRVDFFINGSTGKQLKFFLDGLPLDNMGETQSLNNLPVEQIDRIEIFKGVLPIELGADALGGAINIVTRKEKRDYLDLSYAVSSFNTHKLNLLGKKYWKGNFYAGMQAVAGTTKNNYTVTAQVPNSFGNLITKDVERFHDGYENFVVKGEAGFVDKKWADELSLTISASGLNKELQHNLTMAQPFGKATYRENLINGILKYQKLNLIKNINLSSYFSYNRVKGLFTDTTKNIYTWDGEIVDRKFSGGELSGSRNQLNIYTDILNHKLISTYWIAKDQKLTFSNTLQYYYRTGKDTVAQNYYNGVDYFATPSAMAKNIAGIGYERSFFNQKLKFSTSVKHFYAAMEGYTQDGDKQFKSVNHINKGAYNVAFAYSLNPQLLIKTSFEHASRLPDVEEAFGNLMQIKPYPNIKPEVSDNLNLNLLYQHKIASIELTGFYKNADDLIYLQTSPNSAVYRNILEARIIGIETAFNYHPFSFLDFNANATYQDLRNRSELTDLGFNSDRYLNARLPNIPYLMVNGGISFKRNNFLRKADQLQVWLNSNYTHQYFLSWEIDGAKELKNRIPTQLLHNTGLSYTINNKLTFTLESYNLTNEKTYDNFKVQLPGRSLSFKTRFYIFKS